MTHEEPVISRLDPGVSAALMRFKRLNSVRKDPYSNTEETWVENYNHAVAFCESDDATINGVSVLEVDKPVEKTESMECHGTEGYHLVDGEGGECYVQGQYMDEVLEVFECGFGDLDMYIGEPGETLANFVRIDDPESNALMMVGSWLRPENA